MAPFTLTFRERILPGAAPPASRDFVSYVFCVNGFDLGMLNPTQRASLVQVPRDAPFGYSGGLSAPTFTLYLIPTKASGDYMLVLQLPDGRRAEVSFAHFATTAGTGAIIGRVTNGTSGAPVLGVTVTPCLARSPGGTPQAFCTTPAGPPTARTGPDGSYELRVPAGVYRLQFVPPEGAGVSAFWWNDSRVFQGARDLTSDGVGVLRGIDIALPPAFTIESMITDGGVGVDVQVLVFMGGSAPCCHLVSIGRRSGPSGHYFTTVPPGTYRVEFFPARGFYRDQWWQRAADFGSATDVVVRGNVTGIDCVLVKL